MVAAAPGTSRVFERYGIDFCCGGRLPLEDACAKRGLDAGQVLHELEAAVAGEVGRTDWTSETLGAVVDHILAKHHAFVKREIPRLTALMDKVLRVHGPTHPEIQDLARIWSRTGPGLELHMRKEEEILFPAIRSLEEGRTTAFSCGGGLEGPMRMMEFEHEEHGGALARMRQVAKDYAVPANACGSWMALYGGLDEFEKDLHVHVHLENNVLFPRVRDLAAVHG
jgi:regulator of cell morphogenesis and NO signaling